MQDRVRFRPVALEAVNAIRGNPLSQLGSEPPQVWIGVKAEHDASCSSRPRLTLA
jgi:hypothetical protein